MESKDYSELFLLVKGAEQALLSGQLTDWQHANTSTFHVLASMILDLNARLARLEAPTNQSVDPSYWVGPADGRAAGQNKISDEQIISIYGNGYDGI